MNIDDTFLQLDKLSKYNPIYNIMYDLVKSQLEVNSQYDLIDRLNSRKFVRSSLDLNILRMFSKYVSLENEFLSFDLEDILSEIYKLDKLFTVLTQMNYKSQEEIESKLIKDFNRVKDGYSEEFWDLRERFNIYVEIQSSNGFKLGKLNDCIEEFCNTSKMFSSEASRLVLTLGNNMNVFDNKNPNYVHIFFQEYFKTDALGKYLTGLDPRSAYNEFLTQLTTAPFLGNTIKVSTTCLKVAKRCAEIGDSTNDRVINYLIDDYDLASVLTRDTASILCDRILDLLPNKPTEETESFLTKHCLLDAWLKEDSMTQNLRIQECCNLLEKYEIISSKKKEDVLDTFSQFRKR
jgi:hypothetical protein